MYPCRSAAKSIIATALFLTLATWVVAQPPSSSPEPTPSAPVTGPVEVARISLVAGNAEVRRQNGPWMKAAEEQPLSMGDRIRTLEGTTVRLEFPWTVVAMSDNTEVSLPKSRLLTLQLEKGRIDVDPELALLRIATSEATIGGEGRTLVRRQGAITFVGSYNGGANVKSSTSLVRLGVGKGTIVNAGAPPSEPVHLAEPPKVVSPGSDPPYVRPGQIVHLSWTGRETTYHLEVLPIDSDVPVVSLDLSATSYDLRLTWLGTFRWRVAGRSGAVETVPSGEGLICVVEK